MIFCTIKSKPLALPWGRTPRLDSGVRVSIHIVRVYVRENKNNCVPYGGSVDGSSTSGSADGSLGSGPKPTRDWALPWPVIDSVSYLRSFVYGGVLEKDPAPHLTARQEQAVQVSSGSNVQKGEEQVTLFDSIKHCFVSLDAPAAAHQASGSGSGAGAEVSVSSAEGNVVEENVLPEGAFLDLTDPECDVTVVGGKD
ncbi:hypothetical protein Tco_1541612 [Tanacetum coccineum]